MSIYWQLFVSLELRREPSSVVVEDQEDTHKEIQNREPIAVARINGSSVIAQWDPFDQEFLCIIS